MSEVAVLDLGVGNTASMVSALRRAGARPVLTAECAVLEAAERIVFPGVGAAAYAARRLDELGLTELLKAFPRPMLGVCLGLQLLYERSEEGDAEGLGRLPGEVRRLADAPERPVPHMGWNQLRIVRDDPLLEGVEDGAFVYFVHSYASPSAATTVAITDYGSPFVAIARDGPTCGCQFHPERSGAVGARILANFLALSC